MVTETRIELAERERDRALPRPRDGRGHAEQRVLGARERRALDARNVAASTIMSNHLRIT